MPKCNFLKKFRKTKARTPPSSPLSSNLVHHQPLRAPAPNLNPDGPAMPEAKPPSVLATSATQQPLRGPMPNAIPLSSEITPTSGSTAKDTALNALKLMMQIVADAPVPGIKVAMSGLLTIIGKVQETSGNTQGFLNLATRMENLQPIFSKMKDMEIEGATADIFKKLEVEINSLAAEIEWARSNGTLAKFFNSTDDASSLKSHNDHLDQIIHGAILAITVDIHHEVQKLLTTTDDERRKIFSWLSATVPTNNYDGALEKRLADTASWIFEEDHFVQWRQSSDSVLRLIGKSGSGKTVLCASIIKSIKDDGATCAYFFFDRRDAQGSLQSYDGLLRSITYQLCGHLDAFPDILMASYKNSHSGTTPPSRDVVEQICTSVLQQLPETSIIIDALDECTEIDKVARWLRKIITAEGRRLHVLITSRDEPHITGHLSMIPLQPAIQVDDLTGADVKLYIDSTINNYVGLKGWSPEMQMNIRQSLLAGAGGMFRWVAMQLHALNDCDSYDELTTQLKNLPHDLNQTYQQIFAKIGPHRHDIVLTIMQWLAFSKAPLTVDQICEVVAIVIDDNQYPTFEPGKKWTRQAVEKNCANLVTVMNEEIKLAHFSVKEYLIGLGPKFDKEHSSCFIAKSCLGYLLQFTTLDSLNRENINNFQLAPYAAKYWVDHSQDARESSGESSRSSVLEKLMDDLFQPSGAAFVTWVQVWDLDTPWKLINLARRPATSSLYYASFLGLFHQVQILIQKGEDVNAQGGFHGNALQAASYKGHQEVVKLLIEKGADVNAQGGEYGNALQAASYKGHQEIVKLLIEKGADINAQGGRYGKALQAASYKGHQEIVKLLIEKGADISAV